MEGSWDLRDMNGLVVGCCLSSDLRQREKVNFKYTHRYRHDIPYILEAALLGLTFEEKTKGTTKKNY